MFNAGFVQIVVEADIHLLAKQLGEVGVADEQTGRQVPERQLFHIVGRDVGDGLGGDAGNGGQSRKDIVNEEMNHFPGPLGQVTELVQTVQYI